MSDDKKSSTRRNIIKSLVFVPMGAGAAAALQQNGPAPAAGAGAPNPRTTAEVKPGADSGPYRPRFLNAREWKFVVAACDRLIPQDEHGPGAVELGVPEFLDRHLQSPYAAGEIWYMQGPFMEAEPEFGYQGKLTLKDIIRVGIRAVDEHCAASFSGKAFADLDVRMQEAVLKDLEAGKIKLKDISSKLFFADFLSEVRNGYFSDPIHGGNKNMGSWKMLGYPGSRADYLEWVTIRDKPYPLGPVDQSGRRG
ncbi:gluconate 2-dehydrogenase subunit 3 family protein [Massilia sp.]|uniref:gluconate 2-dehydrogenase subunit 3 family protein n=1 Tax=Massilia sp. TaxID=1882437 RepID=UPI00289DE14B|nr:gluconate 2-dehydrogenase subunit 3 family protein [Massilia sp.]